MVIYSVRENQGSRRSQPRLIQQVKSLESEEKREEKETLDRDLQHKHPLFSTKVEEGKSAKGEELAQEPLLFWCRVGIVTRLTSL